MPFVPLGFATDGLSKDSYSWLVKQSGQVGGQRQLGGQQQQYQLPKHYYVNTSDQQQNRPDLASNMMTEGSYLNNYTLGSDVWNFQIVIHQLIECYSHSFPIPFPSPFKIPFLFYSISNSFSIRFHLKTISMFI